MIASDAATNTPPARPLPETLRASGVPGEAADAIEQGTSIRAEGQGGCAAAQLFQRGQGLRIDQTISAKFDGDFVAANFPFRPHAARNPPHGRMVEEQCLQHVLQEIYQIIVTADVRQLVGQNGLQVRGRQARQGRRRQEDERPQPADHCRGLHQAPT